MNAPGYVKVLQKDVAPSVDASCSPQIPIQLKRFGIILTDKRAKKITLMRINANFLTNKYTFLRASFLALQLARSVSEHGVVRPQDVDRTTFPPNATLFNQTEILTRRRFLRSILGRLIPVATSVSPVKKKCGPARYADSEDPTSIEINTEGNMIKARTFPQLPDQQITTFLMSISQTRNFYDNLAEVMCKDESYVEPKDRRCWNGERIGEYTKTVVDATLDTQKYNPEVIPNTNLQIVDPKVADLADKLRHVHQMVITSLGGVNLLKAESYIQQGDDPEQGSGSGGGPTIEDEDDDHIDASGSGSGNTDEPSASPPQRSATTPKPTGSSAVTYPSFIVLIASFLIKFAV
ncbi:putative cell surface proteoglycan that bears heparan sulfate [Trypoxylus dichotomus]